MSKDEQQDMQIETNHVVSSFEKRSPKRSTEMLKINKNKNTTVKRIPQVFANPLIAGYFRPWRFTPAERSGTSQIFYARTTKFRVLLDVVQFMTKPKDIKVDVVGQTIEIQAEHEMINDTLGQISRWMKRKYKVPPDVNLNTVTSKLHKKGSLVINAERNLEDSLGKDFIKNFPQYASSSSLPTKSPKVDSKNRVTVKTTLN